MDEELDAAAGEVAAMQFAGGMSIAELAVEWDRDVEWVERVVRRKMLEYIPRRDGGLKASRSEVRRQQSEEHRAASELQTDLKW
jgi:hypothetical protein